MTNRNLAILIPILIFAVLTIFPALAQFVPNWLWFKSFGYEQIWLFLIQAKVTAFAIFFLIAFGFLQLNLRVAKWIIDRSRNGFQHPTFSGPFAWMGPIFDQLSQKSAQQPEAQNAMIKKMITWGSLGGGLFFGFKAAANWQLLFEYWNQVPFGIKDPVFGYDIGLYVFTLPFLKALHGWAVGLLLLTVIFCLWVYGARRLLMFIFGTSTTVPGIKRHIFALFALIFAFFAVNAYLSVFSILYNTRGAVFGAGYTDIHILLWFYRIQALLFAAQSGLMLIFAFRRGVVVPVFFMATLLLNAVIVGGILPGIVQTYYVTPNEFQAEKPYMARNIEYTRLAYGLDSIESEPFEANNKLRLAGIQANPSTIKNMRLWNEEPLQQTFGQLQEIRLYYEFPGVDVDRYTIDGELRQVMLSAREMNHDTLTAQAQTWVNKHLIYTHGYGLCMSPVNRVTSEGLPEFFIKDIPPVSSIPNIQITRPQIYYGEKTGNYIITNSNQPEFDYPKGNSNVYTRYSGNGGIALNSWLKRAIYAVAFGDVKILISPAIQSSSRIMYNRNIHDIVKQLAPFIIFENDAYLVIRDNGTLTWMIDGYTTTDAFPYAEPFGKSGNNYIRNSVKVTIDAYTGQTQFYISDAKDPIIQTYAKLYHDMFQPLDAMPADLRSHIRYPKGLFEIQAKMLSTYHMTDPQVFYNREDLWDIPVTNVNEENTDNRMDPYYLVTKLPNEATESFILMMPFTPTHKANMIAWLSVKCDPDSYGKMKVYQFPKERTIYGPQQIDSRINQDTEISQDLTLWGQMGSQVLRGDIMAIPIEQSLIYVEPLYLRATQSKLPELKRVILAFDDQVVMADTLDAAIGQVFGGSYVSQTESETTTDATKQSTTNPVGVSLAKLASQFNTVKKSLRDGDWKQFGVQFETLDQLFKKAQSGDTK